MTSRPKEAEKARCDLCDAPPYLHNNQLPDHHGPECQVGKDARAYEIRELSARLRQLKRETQR